jgi:hypothetical protein
MRRKLFGPQTKEEQEKDKKALQDLNEWLTAMFGNWSR